MRVLETERKREQRAAAKALNVPPTAQHSKLAALGSCKTGARLVIRFEPAQEHDPRLASALAFLIRLALTAVFAYSAYVRIPHAQTLLKLFGIIDGVIAIALLVGFYTQLAALIGTICTAAWLIKSDWNPYPKSTTALALVMCLSILVLGAGPFAFDLPL